MIKRLVKLLTIALLGLSLTWLSGCSATMKETHYIAAHDPDTRATNLFRVKFTGNTWFSEAKFSLGEYDRYSVNLLFSETELQREYLSKKLSLYDDSGKRIKDISSVLQNANSAFNAFDKETLQRLYCSLAEEIGIYEAILSKNSESHPNRVILKRATTLLSEGGQEIENNNLSLAAKKLRQSLGNLQTLRLLLKKGAVVRHFGPDGNEQDVTNKSLLVFVSTDASRFTSAFRQIAESEKATQNLTKIILGPKLIEQKIIENKVQASQNELTALCRRLQFQLDTDTNFSSNDTLKATILQMAKEASGKIDGFKEADEIRAYSDGMGDQP